MALETALAGAIGCSPDGGRRAGRPGHVGRHRGRPLALTSSCSRAAMRPRPPVRRRWRSAPPSPPSSCPRRSAGWRRYGRRPRPSREAMARAGIDDPEDVHFVQVKCPLLTSARIAGGRRARPRASATHDTYASMGLSRGASALGIALALGEVARRGPRRTPPSASRRDLYSGRASASAGIELMRNEIIVLGNAPRLVRAPTPSPTGSCATASMFGDPGCPGGSRVSRVRASWPAGGVGARGRPARQGRALA